MISFVILSLTALAPQESAKNAEPITIYRAVPAKEVTMTKVSTCDDTVFEISYTSSVDDVRGSLRARHEGKIIEADSAQQDMFGKLAYVDSTVAVCGFEKTPSYILITGVDRETGIVGDMYRVGYTTTGGFGQVRGPIRED
ncbi:MAG: hypothetical protein AAGK02_13430 [Pseudomonadota bacterium]